MNEMNVRIGIIGLGKIGHQFGISSAGDPLSHSEAYHRISNVTISLGVDPNPDARQAFQNRFPDARVFASLADVPDRTQLDVVSVCSPTPLHQEGVTAALSWRARVILCEKPLAPTVAEASTMVSECALHNCTLMTNYSRRWTPMLRTLQHLTQADSILGTLQGACLRYNGGLQHNGTHWIDLLLTLLGPVDRAYPLETSAIRESDRAESIALVWKNRLTAYLISVRDTGYSIGEGEIWGTGGLVRYYASGQQVIFQKSQPSVWSGFKGLSEPETICTAGLEGHLLGAVTEAVQLAQFAGDPTCSGEDGVRALQVVEMVRGKNVPSPPSSLNIS